jgi:hypothetical protein
MGAQPSITYVDDARLAELIGSASRRVVFMAPGVTESVACALGAAWGRLGAASVMVILDVDPEVCRIGFGTLDGLKEACAAASRAGATVCQQPGVRIGLLVSDDTTVVYSPTPRLLEDEPSSPERPNGITLAAPPPEVIKEIGLGQDPSAERTVGAKPITGPDITTAAADLASAPPVKFDLARRVRVFTTRFQFVELKLTGCCISRKKAPIPSSLIGLAKDRELQSQFHAHFDLVTKGSLAVGSPDDRLITENSLQKMRLEIERQFLVSLKGYGSVVLRANKAALEKAVAGLSAEVEAFQKGIVAVLQAAMDENAMVLVEALLPAVKGNLPDAYTKFHGPDIPDAQVRQLLEGDIKKAFGGADALVGKMEVSLVFKDVAIESLQDEGFLRIARAAMPGVESLHDEFEAALSTERSEASPTS